MNGKGSNMNSRLLAIAVALLAAGTAQALPADMFTYSGYLADAAGNPITAASDLTFRLYADSTSAMALYEETIPVTPNANGYFSVIVGSATGSLAPDQFQMPRYLTIEVGTEGEMAPRIPLTSVPSAFSALTVDWDGVVNAPAFVQGVSATPSRGLAVGGTASAPTVGLSVCTNPGDVMKWDGAAWSCAPDAGGAGTVTSVTAAPSGGVVIGGTAESPTVGLAACATAGYAMKWDGAAWSCAADVDTNSGGTVVAVVADPSGGMVIGGLPESPSVGLAPCPLAGDVLKWSGTSWGCAPDVDTNSGGTVTAVTASLPLSSTGGATPNITIAAADGVVTGALRPTDFNTFNGKQARVSGSCAVGSAIRAINADGTVVCQAPPALTCINVTYTWTSTGISSWSCASGDTATGGGVSCGSSANVIISRPSTTGEGWVGQCNAATTATSPHTLYVRCCTL